MTQSTGLTDAQSLADAMQILQPQLASIASQLATLTSAVQDSAIAQKATDAKFDNVVGRLEKTLGDVIASLHHSQAELASIKTQVIPAMADHYAKVHTASIITQLAQDVWARKWNVLVYGVKGPAGEPQAATEAAVLDWA